MSVESSTQDGSLAAEPLLRELGRPDTSGVLEVSHPGQDISHVWLRQGGVYAMQVPGYRPALGVRLLSGGLVCPEQLSQAAADQRESLHPRRIGELLVARGHVSPEVVAAFVHEQVLDQLADLLDLEVLGARFHPGRRIRQDVIPPTPVEELLEAARRWRARRVDALRRVGGAHVVPHLRPPGQGSAQTPLGPDDWALLCRVDGRRDIGELARVCGFTLQQAAQIVADLTLTSVLALPDPAPPEPPELAPVLTLHHSPPADPLWEFDGTDAGEPEPLDAGPVGTPSAGPQPPQSDEAAEPLVTAEPVVAAETVVAAEPIVAAEPVESSEQVEPCQPVAAVAACEAAEPGDLEQPLAMASALPDDSAPLALVPRPAHGPSVGHPSPAPATAPTSPAPAHAHAAAPASPATRPPGPSDRTTPRTPAPVPAQVSEPSEAAPPPPPSSHSGEDTSVFMRELSSLSDDPDRDEPIVTRLVVPLTEERRRRRRWGR